MRILALVSRIIQQIRKDKRTLALLFVAPLLVLTLMYFIFDSETSDLKLVVTDVNERVIELLEESEFELFKEDSYSIERMAEEELDGWLHMEEEKLALTLLNEQPSRSSSVKMLLAKTLNVNDSVANSSIETEYVYGDEETKIFDIFSPMLVGFFVFFFVFLIAGIALLNERTSGTLERLLATPIKRYEIVFGYVVGYGLFALIQTIIVVLYSVKVLDIVLEGSIWLVLLINILVAFVALSLGTLLSSFASSEFQMVQFIPLVIVPQVFFSGIFPIEGMAEWLQQLGKIMPLYYASDALNGVMYKGFTIYEIAGNLLVLLGFAIVFITLNIVSLKKYRSI
ncbi:ABC transporter permease [Ureibacillus acetophenoni]|uniref:ABC-2 type transport system permease protein n=1 Tax=Ureibacillus acetophenoni TaxID=614649 RepID=A0A285UKI5_9BACL|nr:ABC transporter permease [Ureibacillus acetophenoni]SOC42400.1 ABC-2 type transport system permease protein [Ureibacillus acetophenoni]